MVRLSSKEHSICMCKARHVTQIYNITMHKFSCWWGGMHPPPLGAIDAGDHVWAQRYYYSKLWDVVYANACLDWSNRGPSGNLMLFLWLFSCSNWGFLFSDNKHVWWRLKYWSMRTISLGCFLSTHLKTWKTSTRWISLSVGWRGVGTHDLYICISICILGLALPLQNLGEESGSLLRADLGDPKQKECCRILRSFGKMCA